MYKKLTDLSGKQALVSGGGRGIGLCAADALAEAGACVVIVDLSEQLLEEGLAFLRSKGHEVEGLVLDVSDSDATERVAEEVETNGVDGKSVPVRHFGAVLDWDHWHQLADSLKDQGVEFLIEPYIRFQGEVGEQATMFLLDPSDNAIELKSFQNPEQLFAS